MSAPAGQRVRVLPPEVAAQIAAGEVIERPASVVKELVENALDAGAQRVTIELEGAGSQLIAVVDDGAGMARDDAVCAFERHATSKVACREDLERIATLGFRGEALASIAAVSQTVLVTRRADDLGGHRIAVAHGAVRDVRAAGTPVGTRVEVHDLFGNVPARRKFLKAPATEVGHVSELVTRTALAWPQVGFVLRSNGRTLVELAPVGEPVERVRQVYGGERARALLPFVGRGAAGGVHGWVSESALSFPSARQIYTYVNRRYVRDKLVSHALVAGYSTLLMHGRYPAAAVFLEVPLDEVDVNVHPAKSEVRFRRAGAVHELLSHAVQARLREGGSVPLTLATAASPYASAQMPLGVPPAGPTLSWGAAMRPLRLVDVGEHRLWPPVEPSSNPFRGREGEQGRGESPLPRPVVARSATHGLPASEGFFSGLRVIGQVFEGYVVCESGEQLVLIDQHAAHERVTFEHLRLAYGQGAIMRQQLLMPVVVDLAASEMGLLAEHAAELEAMGFDVEPFGAATMSVRAVPALLGDADAAGLLREVAEELADMGHSRRLAEAAESVLARLACHSAVRAGQSMGPAQIQALLRAMDRIDFAGNCPHGRPAYVTLARGELERWFKRT